MTEKEYYEKQAKLMADVITILGGILTTIMSVGAIAGAMNTMYAAVSQRKREIGCLLAMGFTPEAVWLAFMIESLALAALGAVLGCAVSLSFHGMKTGMTNWATFSETAFRVPRHAADPRDRHTSVAADGLHRRRDPRVPRGTDEGRRSAAPSVGCDKLARRTVTMRQTGR